MLFVGFLVMLQQLFGRRDATKNLMRKVIPRISHQLKNIAQSQSVSPPAPRLRRAGATTCPVVNALRSTTGVKHGVKGTPTIGELVKLKRQNEELLALVGELTLASSRTQKKR
jgi:hypothetical protein